MLVYERVNLVENPTKILSAIQVNQEESDVWRKKKTILLQTDKGQYKAGDLVKLRILLHDNFLRNEVDLLVLTKRSRPIWFISGWLTQIIWMHWGKMQEKWPTKLNASKWLTTLFVLKKLNIQWRKSCLICVFFFRPVKMDEVDELWIEVKW